MTDIERKAAIRLFEQAKDLADAADNVRGAYDNDDVNTLASDTVVFCRGVEALLWRILDGKLYGGDAR